jgi:hypothetical protein
MTSLAVSKACTHTNMRRFISDPIWENEAFSASNGVKTH